MMPGPTKPSSSWPLILGAFCLAWSCHGLIRAADVTPPANAALVQPAMDAALAKDWLARWEKSILQDVRGRPCDREMGEELGWIVSPFLDGFHHGYLATRDPKWIDLLIDWSDAIIKRGVSEPDGQVGAQ